MHAFVVSPANKAIPNPAKKIKLNKTKIAIIQPGCDTFNTPRLHCMLHASVCQALTLISMPWRAPSPVA